MVAALSFATLKLSQCSSDKPAPARAIAASRAAPSSIADPLPSAAASSSSAAEAKAAADRIRRLETQLDQLRAENAVTRGRLKAVEGEVQPWTKDLPITVQPSAFRAELSKLVDAAGGTVEEVDCSEYPCVAAIRWPAGITEADLMRRVDGVEDGLKALGASGDALSTYAKTSRFAKASDPAGAYSLSSMSLMSAARDPGVRVDVRARELVGNISTSIAGENGN